jgi:hypothetical protein
MTSGYLLNRVLLRFDHDALHHDLSAVAYTDGYLWLGSDEENSIERLTQLDTCVFGNHECFRLTELLDQFDDDAGEVDIEGMTSDGSYLWIVGSHSTKRKKVKPEKVERLTKVKLEPNRYLLARIPLAENRLHHTFGELRSAYLEQTEDGNTLIAALKTDEYFAPFLAEVSDKYLAIPGKDNGFDIEGLAIHEGQILLGLRGPVLRGIAVVLQLVVEETEPGKLSLKPIGENGELYKKHFLDLDGFGIRDLCCWGEDLLILAGPTMDLDGTITLYRLHHPFALPDQSFTVQTPGELEPLFDIPHRYKADRAEGVTLFPAMNRTDTVMVVYDSPTKERQIGEGDILADVFTLQ